MRTLPLIDVSCVPLQHAEDVPPKISVVMSLAKASVKAGRGEHLNHSIFEARKAMPRHVSDLKQDFRLQSHIIGNQVFHLVGRDAENKCQ